MTKDMTVRLEDTLATELDTVAGVDGHPVAQAVRIAISEYIERRRDSEDFQRKLRTHIERMRRMISSEPDDAPSMVFPLETTRQEIDARTAFDDEKV